MSLHWISLLVLVVCFEHETVDEFRIRDWSAGVCSTDLIWTAAGSTIWITALAGAGSWFGKRFANLYAVVGPVAVAAIGALILLYLWRVITWRPKTKNE